MKCCHTSGVTLRFTKRMECQLAGKPPKGNALPLGERQGEGFTTSNNWRVFLERVVHLNAESGGSWESGFRFEVCELGNSQEMLVEFFG